MAPSDFESLLTLMSFGGLGLELTTVTDVSQDTMRIGNELLRRREALLMSAAAWARSLSFSW